MIHSITAKLTYIQFRSTDIETAEKFFQHKIKKVDDKIFEMIDDPEHYHLYDGTVYAKLNGVDFPIVFSSIETLLDYFNNKEKNTDLLKNFETSEPTKEKSYTTETPKELQQIDLTKSKICISKSINVGNELERILSTINEREIHLDNPEKYQREKEIDEAVLYNFNVGLLCGIKLSGNTK